MFSRGAVFGQTADSVDLSDEINTYTYTAEADKIDKKLGRLEYKYHVGFSPVHNTDRLPKEFVEMEKRAKAEGDLRAVTEDKIPPINAWTSAAYTLTGILAHESAMSGSKILKFPDIGEIPSGKDLLSFD